MNKTVQALAGEIVAALIADENEGGYDLTAGLFGPAFSALVRRWAAAPQSEQPESANVIPRHGFCDHPDDETAEHFCAALKWKLADARNKGRGGWELCSPEELSQMLREHVEKGDPRDVANFCMFLWAKREAITK